MNLQDLDIIKLKQFEDKRGMLLPVEFSDLPFTPQRMFFVTHHGTFDAEKRVRGKHANKVCQQYFFVIAGKVEVSLFDGEGKQRFTIMAGQGIFIDNMIWNSYKAETMIGHTNIYLVLASHPYDPADYITDRNEFIKIKTGK